MDTSFGAQLRALRQAKGLSLRDVEVKSEKNISNPYLSQLENNKIKKPSPHILHKLADLYGVEYEMLMEAAGYLSRKETSIDVRTLAGVALRNLDDLTPDEEAAVMDYISFIRSKRP
jgi:transcriptional regulator with XRE-family HTH domain